MNIYEQWPNFRENVFSLILNNLTFFQKVKSFKGSFEILLIGLELINNRNNSLALIKESRKQLLMRQIFISRKYHQISCVHISL